MNVLELGKSYHLLSVPLLASPKEVHVDDEGDVFHHHQHVCHLFRYFTHYFGHLLSFLIKLPLLKLNL